MGNRAGVPDISDEDYTYETRNRIVATIPSKVAGVKVESLPPLTPYPERNDKRFADIEARLAHVEAMLHQALNRESTP